MGCFRCVFGADCGECGFAKLCFDVLVKVCVALVVRDLDGKFNRLSKTAADLDEFRAVLVAVMLFVAQLDK